MLTSRLSVNFSWRRPRDSLGDGYELRVSYIPAPPSARWGLRYEQMFLFSVSISWRAAQHNIRWTLILVILLIILHCCQWGERCSTKTGNGRQGFSRARCQEPPKGL